MSAPIILATGGWPDTHKHKCPASPKGRHAFREKSAKPGRAAIGERLVTSECLHCKALVVDCPTISA